MTIIYFYPFESQSLDGSGSAQVYSYYSSEQLITNIPNPVLYSDCLVVITGSIYALSGSVDRINIYDSSGSRQLLATYPIENTTVVYPVTGGANAINPTQDTLLDFELTDFGLEWSLTTSTVLTSSLNQLAVYSGSTPATYSIYESGSSNSGYLVLPMAATYSVHVSGGGTYYTTSLKLEDTYYGNTIAYLTASNSDISYSLSESYNGVFGTYKLTATAESLNGILLEYGTSAIPVANSGSVSEWNSLLGIAANKVELSGNNVYLLGGTLTNTGSLIISSSVSSSILNGGLKKLSTFGVTDLFDITIVSGSVTGSLTEFPSIPGNSLSSIIVTHQKITGSAINPTLYKNPTLIDCSYNQLSGSLPTFTTQSNALYYYDCSNNALTGSIPNLSGLVNLQYFNTRNNKLSDYASSSLPNSLVYIDAYQNNLSENAIEGLVKDAHQAGNIIGYLNLSGSGNSTASLVTLETASLLEIDRGWQVYLNGVSTIISASFFDNLYGIPIIPGVNDGLSSSYYSFVDDTLPLTYIYLTGSVYSYSTSFRASDSHSFTATVNGWTFTTGSDNISYTASLQINEISASVITTIFSGSSFNSPISSSFTSSQDSRYSITGFITYTGSYYEDILKYAEAVGLAP